MKAAPEGEVTGLLKAWGQGDSEAAERLIPLVYAELRRLAARHVRRERRNHTLQPSALVHEAYLRLVGQRQAVWQCRGQFFAVASQAMRRVLVDHARRNRAAKRAGGWRRITLDEGLAVEVRDLDVLALEEALGELAALDPQKAHLVELRFFGGLNLEDTADVLGVSAATVSREWRLARAWLFRRLRPEASIRGAGAGTGH